MKRNTKEIFFILAFVACGVLTRTVFHIAPNVEFVTALSLASGYFLPKRYSFAVPLGIMLVSDFILGNTAIYLFTWSAYIIAWVFGLVLRGLKNNTRIKKITDLFKSLIPVEASGILFTIFFFLWTNLGVVLVSSMYPKTLEGVLLSYKMGIPFLVPQLVGNIIIVPSVFLIVHMLYGLDYKTVNKYEAKTS